MRAIVVCAVLMLAAGASAEQWDAAAVWNSSGAVTVLPTPAGYDSEATGINSAGHVVGWINGPTGRQAALWVNNAGVYTRHTLPTLPGMTKSWANDINDSNWIAGAYDTATARRGFYYTPSPSLTSGDMHQIPNSGTATYENLYARRISDAGWVAGSFSPRDMPDSTFGEYRAFRYDAANQTAFAEIGVLDNGYRSYGRDVDDIGRTVGVNVAPNAGFYYDGGVITEIPSLYQAVGITDTGGHVVGYGPDGDVRIVTLEGDGAGVENIGIPPGASQAGPLDINNRGDVCGNAVYDAFKAVWYDRAAGQWHPLTAMTGTYAVAIAISDNSRMAGRITYDDAAPLPLASGGGTIAHQPTGFADADYTTAGMPAGSVALDQTIELDNLTFVPDTNGNEMVTLTATYDEAELAAKGIDEATLRLYWHDEAMDEWVLAGRHSNLDKTTGAFVNGPPTNVLGDWGLDAAGDLVWANIDHASTYAIAGIPEPATLGLLTVGAVALIRRRK